MSTTKWNTPAVLSDAEAAFGVARRMDELLPQSEDIPNEFKQFPGTKWNEIQSRWGFQGLPEGTDFQFKQGIDGKAALKHLAAIQRSFAPKHEHKEAAVAWLMSLWLDDVVFPKGTK